MACIITIRTSLDPGRDPQNACDLLDDAREETACAPDEAAVLPFFPPQVKVGLCLSASVTYAMFSSSRFNQALWCLLRSRCASAIEVSRRMLDHAKSVLGRPLPAYELKTALTCFCA